MLRQGGPRGFAFGWAIGKGNSTCLITRKIELQEAADLKAVRLKDAPDRLTRAALAARPVREDGGEELGLFGLTLYRGDATAETRRAATTVTRAPRDEVAETFPVFRTAEMGTDAALILTPQLIVQFKAGLSETDCKKLLDEARLEVVKQEPLTKNYYVCRLRNGSAAEALTNYLLLGGGDQLGVWDRSDRKLF
jgi:hypothetical protein